METNVQLVHGWTCPNCGSFNLLRDTPAVRYDDDGRLCDGECPDCEHVVTLEYDDD